MRFETRKDAQGVEYIPVARLVAPDAERPGKVWRGNPVALPGDGDAASAPPVGFFVLPINGTRAGKERAKAIAGFDGLAEKFQAGDSGSVEAACDMMRSLVDTLFAHYSEEVREDILDRATFAAFPAIINAAMGLGSQRLRVDLGAASDDAQGSASGNAPSPA